VNIFFTKINQFTNTVQNYTSPNLNAKPMRYVLLWVNIKINS